MPPKNKSTREGEKKGRASSTAPNKARGATGVTAARLTKRGGSGATGEGTIKGKTPPKNKLTRER